MPHYSLLTLSLVLATAYASGDDAFEWAGIFETPDNVYWWGAEKVDGAYVDPGMKIVLLPATAADEEALEALEASGESAIEGTCQAVAEGGTITPAANTCYQLNFDANKHSSLFRVDTTGVANVAFFAEHVPTEFERNSHYLKDVGGEDIEPGAELPHAAAKKKPWGVAIGAAIIVNIVTFIGIVFLVPLFSRCAKKYPGVLSAVVNAFAAGALLSASFYLMLYEATHLIKPEGSTEPEQIGWWGSAVLLGFLAVYIVDLFTSAIFGNIGAQSATATAKTPDSEEGAVAVEVAQRDPGRRTRVLGGVLIGDFMHNFADGIFMGVGFYSCGNGFGWKITGATVAHEIAQELADYLVLTDPYQGNLKPWKALVCNFISGTSVILGVIAYLAQGSEDNFSIGMVLAFGGGIYLQIGGAECMPRVMENAKSLKMKISALLVFIIGAMAIGLVLLDHEHCAPDGGHAH